VADLRPANAVSDPPSGKLAFFALEGDLTIAAQPMPGKPCGYEEFVQVTGDPLGNSTPICFNDDDNPPGNIFNSTINGQPRAGELPECTRNEAECCRGDGICGVTGVDIDDFDVSEALVAGSENIQVRIGSGADRVALATLVLGVDVFEPLLQEDTQMRALHVEDNLVRLGSSVDISVAVSNTGNVPAHDVALRFDAPAHVNNLVVLAIPEGGAVVVNGTGGEHGTGQVLVNTFDVGPGEIREVRVRVRVDCEAAGLTLQPAAFVSSILVPTFELPPLRLIAGGPGEGACEGADPNGPFAEVLPPRALRGGC
jgi:hypothetical protein